MEHYGMFRVGMLRHATAATARSMESQGHFGKNPEETDTGFSDLRIPPPSPPPPKPSGRTNSGY